MSDLFASQSALSDIPLPGANVAYQPQFELGVPPDALLQELIVGTPWRQEGVTVWGKTFRQPRLVAWYDDPGKSYCYSGVVLESLPWTERISSIRAKVEAAVQHKFNSVLLNYYRDENDSMALHSDDEKELGPNPVIASIRARFITASGRLASRRMSRWQPRKAGQTGCLTVRPSQP